MSAPGGVNKKFTFFDQFQPKPQRPLSRITVLVKQLTH